MPEIDFDRDRTLTSFAGLGLFQALFAPIGPRSRLRAAFAHLGRQGAFGLERVFLQGPLPTARRSSEPAGSSVT